MGPKRSSNCLRGQGCSSCPPADRLLGALARNPAMIAVSFPVDYWDYIGWKDTLASPGFTARQKAYAVVRGDGHIYTPQIVVDGRADVVGSDKDEVKRAIDVNEGPRRRLERADPSQGCRRDLAYRGRPRDRRSGTRHRGRLYPARRPAPWRSSAARTKAAALPIPMSCAPCARSAIGTVTRPPSTSRN